MKILQLKNVYKDYKLENKEKFTALNDINMSFEKGELVSIIGESGSGKSTLMNLIGGLDSDYRGEIIIGEQDLKNFKQKELDDYRKKKIGFVFQSFNLIPHLSVIDNVTIGLTLSGVKEGVKHEKAIALLNKLGLGDQIKKKPTQLSGGQKQRVAIARALINDPDIILADEPTGALDSTTTLQILDILKDIADSGKLVIMVTHSEKVAKISSRIIEISDGKLVRDEKNKDYIPNLQKNDEIYETDLNKNSDINSVIKSELNKEETTQNSQAPNFDEAKIKNKRKNKKNKEGHLSILSALKLSIHNMWASKVKNFLMAIGVSISLISLILMLSFGAGLTGYISDQALSYSSPNVATITKRGSTSIVAPKSFTDEEIADISLNLNEYLESKNSDFRVVTKNEDEYDYNLSYGFSMMTGFGNGSSALAKIIYQPEETEDEEEAKPKECPIFYSYTTPPYYNEKHLLTENSSICGDGQIMLSSAAAKAMGIEKIEDVVGKKVILSINLPELKAPIETEVEISGIVDVSMFSGMLVMYVDYDYLNSRFKENNDSKGLSPTTLYITTNNTKATKLINDYVSTQKELSGSLEEKLVRMFDEMLDTFSIALTIIAGISLAVALIMILVVLYISVSERTKEIGVLKSIGARKKDIKLIFSTESFLVGLLAGITGIIFTLIIGGILTLVFNILIGFAPIKMMWYFFVEALAISIFISVLAGLYPSAKASKLDPIESLRHE